MTRKREQISWEWEKEHLKDIWNDEEAAKGRLRKMMEFVYRNPRVLDE